MHHPDMRAVGAGEARTLQYPSARIDRMDDHDDESKLSELVPRVAVCLRPDPIASTKVLA